MIDEDVLRDLLREAADAVPPPGHAAEDLAADLSRKSAPPAPAVRQRRRELGMQVLKVAAAIVAVVGVVAVIAQLGSGTSDDSSSAKFNDVGASIPKTADESGGNDAAAGPTDSAKIVKTGSIEIEVGPGRFERTITLISTKVTGLGGYISKSETSESSAQPSGSLTVRVPVDSYEHLLAELRELGRVGSVSSKGTDVTAQFTDLQARLDALVATRNRLNSVLAQASTVGDILAVQDRITQVQTQIEQIQGQQQVLQDEASFGTIAIAVGEPGSEVRTEPVDDGEGLGQAWDTAKRRFGDGIEGLVSWSGPLAILVIIGAVLALVARLGWVIVRRFTL